MGPKGKQKSRGRIDHRTRVGRERTARTQTRILEAAMRVFADMGPDRPKIDDFARAAGISRGTFYNHFVSVDALLEATSEWTTRRVLEEIEVALAGVTGPALRLGLGLRLFLAVAQEEPVWCRFVARVWNVGGVELPSRDLEEGGRLGIFQIGSVAAARDLVLGTMREALARIGEGRAPPDYCAHLPRLCLQALGTDPRRIHSVMMQGLPSLREESRARAST